MRISSSRQFGAILLIVGTSIGGAMLSLPIATARMGFTFTFIFLIAIWLLMTLGALCIVEAGAQLPLRTNLISMARIHLGWMGHILTWIVYLALLYSLMSAYTDAVRGLMASVAHGISSSTHTLATAVVIALFSVVVYGGIRHVDWTNRFIVSLKLLAYLGMVVLILWNTHIPLLSVPQEKTGLFSNLMIIITAYGFAIIVPSLKTYFHNNILVLKRSIWIGSLIPLVCYLLWEYAIFGTLSPIQLNQLSQSTEPVHTLMTVLQQMGYYPVISVFATVFSSLCIVTAFLGVALSLYDFLKDGLRYTNRLTHQIILYGLTFVVPFVLAFCAHQVFLYGLKLAGSLCIILLMLIPAWMVLCRRLQCTQDALESTSCVPGGMPLLCVFICVALSLLCGSIVF